MILEFDDNMNKLSVIAQGDELAQFLAMDKDDSGKRVLTHPESKQKHVVNFENPVLVTDNYKISKLSPELRDTVFALFSSPIKTTIYDGVSLKFEQKKYLSVWGPSIDTILFCKALKKLDLSGVKTAIEVGFGSGYISKYIISKTTNLERIDMVDINPYAILCAQNNIDSPKAMKINGDGIEFMKGRKYDLIVCNPPYIPRPKSIDDNPYEGVSLLYYLIAKAKEHLNEGGRLIINISNLCEDIANNAIFEGGVNATKIDEMHVPLKVFNVINNAEWLEYLKQKGLKEEDDGYRYWQTIMIYDIKA